MARYHVKADGSMGPCTAREGNCPFGDEEGTKHFTSETEARAYSEKMIAGNSKSRKALKRDAPTAIGPCRAIPRRHPNPSPNGVIPRSTEARTVGYPPQIQGPSTAQVATSSAPRRAPTRSSPRRTRWSNATTSIDQTPRRPSTTL